MLTKKDLYVGVERNIVVYDTQADPGRITFRLFALMEEIWSNDFREEFTINEIMPPPSEIYLKTDTEKLKYYYINDLQAWYPEGDSNLVVIVGPGEPGNREVLLGSY